MGLIAMSTPDTMDTIDEAEQAWREYKNNSPFFFFFFFLLDTVSSIERKLSRANAANIRDTPTVACLVFDPRCV